MKFFTGLLTSSRAIALLSSQPPSCRLPLIRHHTRHYSILGAGAFKPKQYTKYRITKPFTENTDYDDMYLAEPCREDLIKITKDGPLFLRFLRILTEEEKRPDAFKEFAKRCEAGLIVEKDVYITTTELLEQLWENGYSDLEINAYDVAFPRNYKFHYPELAVLFDLTEEDCYKYCMRVRASKPDELVEIKHKGTSNAVASYGVTSVAVWFGLQNNVLGNIWMMVKTWPFFAVFYMLSSFFQKNILSRLYSDTTVEHRVATENRLEGEGFVYAQMKKYANDSKCLEFLEAFKPSVQTQLEQYKQALLRQLRSNMVEDMTKHLVAVQQQEKAVESALQEVIVSEIVEAFNEAYDNKLRDAAFDSAVEALGNPSDGKIADVVGVFFKNCFKELSGASPVKSSIRERVATVFANLEKEFLDNFTVRPKEAESLTKLAKKAGPNLDLGKLDEKERKTVEELHDAIISRVGLRSLTPHLNPGLIETADTACSNVAANVNELILSANQMIEAQRLKSLLRTFA